ncbi:IclR family transcriptional regulator [Teichococcus deserti]|uniref:IclR family transcriptional regulator n=1 Tax=Teichococcus deserti TaxID=1817963 RepID=UPI001A97661E|nr:IclR family transcriptional regulator [Pseudoroseomonas deserti]
MAPEAAEGAQRQRGVDRVIDLLEALLRARAPLRIGELARRIDAPRSTTYSLVKLLLAADVLEASEDGNAVYFGRAIGLYGHAYTERNPIHRLARPVLERLAREDGCTAQLCALHGDKYVVLDSVSAGGIFRITAEIGVPVPIPWTASGRLLLAGRSDAEIRALIPAADYDLPDGRRIDPAGFLENIRQARRDGFCVTTSLSDRFTSCLAAPLQDAQGRVVATLCFVTAADQPAALKAGLVAALVAAAATLSASLP